VSADLRSIHFFKGAARNGNIALISEFLDLKHYYTSQSNEIVREVALEACRAGREAVLNWIANESLVLFCKTPSYPTSDLPIVTLANAVDFTCFNGHAFIRTCTFLESRNIDLADYAKTLTEVAYALGSTEALTYLDKKFEVIDKIIMSGAETDRDFAIRVLNLTTKDQFSLAQYIMGMRGKSLVPYLDFIYDRIFEGLASKTPDHVASVAKMLPFLMDFGIEPHRGCLFRLEYHGPLSVYAMTSHWLRIFELMLWKGVHIKPQFVSVVIQYCRDVTRLSNFLTLYVNLERDKLTSGFEVLFSACHRKSLSERKQLFRILDPFKLKLGAFAAEEIDNVLAEE